MRTEDVYRALWRYKLLILLGTACAATATWFLTSRETKIYQATTLVRVQQRTADPAAAYGLLDANAQLAQTYADITQTNNIAQRIATRYDPQISMEQIHIDAVPVANLALLWIKARSPDPKIAQTVASAAPQALQEFIKETGTLNDSIQVVEKADLPTTPVSPNVKLALIIGVLFGLILNGSLALGWSFMSDRITDLDELERMAGVPVLAIIPPLRFSTRASDSQRLQTDIAVGRLKQTSLKADSLRRETGRTRER